MVIYFYENIVAKTLKTVKEAYDCADICKDINRIERAIDQAQNYGDWYTANQLDHELRQKYPCINAMINIASSIPLQIPQATRTNTLNEAVIESLRQDYYGILCDTAIKKDFIHRVEEFIKTVD
jgi:conjugal transfer/entry exclusion protein